MQIRFLNLSCLLIVSGCAGPSQGEAVRDARIERVEGQTAAKEDADERRADSRNDAVDQHYDHEEQRVEASNRPGEDGSEKLVEVSAERTKYQAEARGRMDAMATRINAVQQKIQVLGNHAPLSLKTELQTASKQYDAIKMDVQRLDKTPPDKWEGTTQRLEDQEQGLDARLTKLEDSIDDR